MKSENFVIVGIVGIVAVIGILSMISIKNFPNENLAYQNSLKLNNQTNTNAVGQAYSSNPCSKFLSSWQCKDAESQGYLCDWDYRRNPPCYQSIARPQPQQARSAAQSNNCELIHKGGNGDAAKNLNIVWVGDRFPDLKTYKLITDSIKFHLLQPRGLFPESDSNLFSVYKDRINIWRVNKLTSLDCSDKSGPHILCDKNKVKSAARTCTNVDIIGAYRFDNRWRGTAQLEGFTIGEFLKRYFMNFFPYSYFVVKPRDLRAFDTIYYAATMHDDMWVQWWLRNLPLRDGGYGLGGELAARITSHELGHVIAQLPDYYELYPDKRACTNHPSIMCDNSRWDYGNKKLSLDRVRMVQTMNQYCNAEVTSAGYPYPNPFNPTRAQTQKIRYKVSYPRGGDPCYILMHVYNVKGQEVRALVTDKPLPSGNYVFEWDGKNNDLQDAASGTYFYYLTGGVKSNGDWSRFTAKGTLLK